MVVCCWVVMVSCTSRKRVQSRCRDAANNAFDSFDAFDANRFRTVVPRIL